MNGGSFHYLGTFVRRGDSVGLLRKHKSSLKRGMVSGQLESLKKNVGHHNKDNCT